MKSLVLTAEAPVTEGILNCFQFLSSKQKKIFLYIQWIGKNFRNVFPCFKTIAEKCECSIPTAKRAIKYFESMGWLCHQKRSYRSNIYFMDRQVLQLDLTSPNAFRKVTPTLSNDPKNDTQNDTVLYVASSYPSILRTNPVNQTAQKVTNYGIPIQDSERKDLKDMLIKYGPSKRLDLTRKDVEDLIKNFMRNKPQSILIRALDAISCAKNALTNPIGLLFRKCGEYNREFREKTLK